MSGGATTTYRYDAGWNVLNRYGAGGTQTYVHGPGGGILADASGVDLSTGTYRYYAHDHLGSTRGLYDGNKSGIGSYEYTPYGEDFSHTGQTATARYTGHLWDNTADLYWAPYRYYAPSLARWLTRDPLGMIDGPGVYGYVRGNPLNAVDPLGLVTKEECAIQRFKKVMDAREETYHKLTHVFYEAMGIELVIVIGCAWGCKLIPMCLTLCALAASGLALTLESWLIVGAILDEHRERMQEIAAEDKECLLKAKCDEQKQGLAPRKS